MGRPSTYDPELAEKICELLTSGPSLLEICKSPEMPAESTVRLWALDNVQGFAAKYARARELGYLRMADEMLGIADDGFNDWMERRKANGEAETIVDHEHIARSRLRFDARRWLLSKCLPKIYGDRLEHVGPDGGPIQVSVSRFTGSEPVTIEGEVVPQLAEQSRGE